MDCSPPGSSVHGILQARILQWVAMPSSRWSSQPRGWIQVSCIPGRFFTIWAKREPLHPSYPGLNPGQGTKRPFFMTTHCSLSIINTRIFLTTDLKLKRQAGDPRDAGQWNHRSLTHWLGPVLKWHGAHISLGEGWTPHCKPWKLPFHLVLSTWLSKAILDQRWNVSSENKSRVLIKHKSGNYLKFEKIICEGSGCWSF